MDTKSEFFTSERADLFGSKLIEHPEKNLFVWALFLNRIELAKIFWRVGEHQIMCALFAANLIKKFLENNLIEPDKFVFNYKINF